MTKNQPKRPSTEASRTDRPLEEVPPVIIKGGSISVLFRGDKPFTVDEFDDPMTKTKVRRVSHPDNVKIFKVEIRDNRAGQRDKLLCSFALPDDFMPQGQFDINIFAE